MTHKINWIKAYMKENTSSMEEALKAYRKVEAEGPPEFLEAQRLGAEQDRRDVEKVLAEMAVKSQARRKIRRALRVCNRITTRIG